MKPEICVSVATVPFHLQFVVAYFIKSNNKFEIKAFPFGHSMSNKYIPIMLK